MHKPVAVLAVSLLVVFSRENGGPIAWFSHPREGTRLPAPKTAAVLIENGTNKEIGAPSEVQAHVPAGATIIDLGLATLLPRMIRTD
jgi:hypothetical protein